MNTAIMRSLLWTYGWIAANAIRKYCGWDPLGSQMLATLLPPAMRHPLVSHLHSLAKQNCNQVTPHRMEFLWVRSLVKHRDRDLMEVSGAPSGGQAVAKSSVMLALSPSQVLNISSDWRWPQGPRHELKVFHKCPSSSCLFGNSWRPSFSILCQRKASPWKLTTRDWKSRKCTRNINKPRCERTHETTAIFPLELWEVPAYLAQHLRASLQLCSQSFGHVFNNAVVEVRE